MSAIDRLKESLERMRVRHPDFGKVLTPEEERRQKKEAVEDLGSNSELRRKGNIPVGLLTYNFPREIRIDNLHYVLRQTQLQIDVFNEGQLDRTFHYPSDAAVMKEWTNFLDAVNTMNAMNLPSIPNETWRQANARHWASLSQQERMELAYFLGMDYKGGNLCPRPEDGE